MSTTTTAAAPTSAMTNVIGGNVKQAKFDRQLRLWGADGQAALEAAHVVALGVTPAIAEALKSLVLTGVPTVTLVDERLVTPEDVATNYFVPPAALGQPLAATVLQHICALGEQCVPIAANVTPTAWVTDYVQAVQQDWEAGRVRDALYASANALVHAHAAGEEEAAGTLPAVTAFLSRFSPLPSSPESAGAEASKPVRGSLPLPSLILVSERYGDLSFISPLVQTCMSKLYPDVPVVLVRSSGLLGMVQAYCPDRVITRPQNPTQVKMEDLRIFEPFPALQAWFDAHDPDDAQQFSLDNADSMTLHSHLPYPCIVYHAYRRWWASLAPEAQEAMRQRHAAAASSPSSIFPLSAKEYREISGVVAGMIRRQSPAEEAFLEAMEKCTAKLNRPVVQRVPEALGELLSDPRCETPTLAAEELLARLCPASSSLAPSNPAGPASWLIWTNGEVLTWFVLHALRRFVLGEIGSESDAAPQRPRQDSVSEHGTVIANAARMNLVTSRPSSGTDASATASSPASPATSSAVPRRVSALHMPFSGYLPDFTTTTMWYRELQDLYHAKHQADVRCIAEAAWELVQSASGVADAALAAAVQPLLLRLSTTIVENVWDLRKVSFFPVREATQAWQWRAHLGSRFSQIVSLIDYDVEWNAAAQRAACLALAFLTKEELRRTAPTAAAITVAQMVSEALQMVRVHDPMMCVEYATADPLDHFAPWFRAEAGQTLFRKACEEVLRWDASERSVQMPSVAASTGALAAQEAVKLIMRIRIPSGDPVLYDGYSNKVFSLKC